MVLRVGWSGGRGPVGVVLHHGLTGTPSEVRPLGVVLARSGLRVIIPWLPGHGETPESLSRVRWTDWARVSEQAYDELSCRCRKVFAAGLSMGALLAIRLGLERECAGVVSMAAPIHVTDLRYRGLAFFRFLQRRTGELTGGVRDPQAPVHETYPVCPTKSLYEMKKLADGLSSRLRCLRAPLLVLQGRLDSKVHPSNADYLYRRAGSERKRLVFLENSDHVLPLDYDREIVFRRVRRFIRTNGKSV